MLKLSRFSLAIVLGLLMGLTLFTSGVFAQSVHSSASSATTHTAVATNTQHIASTALQTTGTLRDNAQQAVRPASYNQSSCGWNGCYRHYRHWNRWGWNDWGGYGWDGGYYYGGYYGCGC